MNTETIRPLTVRGTCNQALVYAKAIEKNCEDLLRQYLDHPAFAGTSVRIMPDVHVGKGAVVGFTATASACAVPSLIGVDIGCGVSAWDLGKGSMPFDKLDTFIRKRVPVGQDTHDAMHEKLAAAYIYATGKDESAFGVFKNTLREICQRQSQNLPRVFAGLGTLGGGNHFIEIDKDEQKNRWLVIHSGSRNFGYRVADFHQEEALRLTPCDSPIKYLEGESAAAYRADMYAAQEYARVSRALMGMIIIEGFFRQDIREARYIESIHNYCDPEDNIVRKGAISARAGQTLIIPFSMAEGAVIATGRGNPEWNNSAPHGAGRKISRSQARAGLSLDEYRKRMRGIWSSCVGKDTLDESPMAYKRTRDVLDYIGDTVDVRSRLLPVYNFKAGEN